MRRRSIALRAAVVLSAAAATAASSAVAQTPAQPAQGPHWTVDHGEVYCTLSRNNGPDATFFAIRVIPGTDRVELLLTDRSWVRTPLSYGQLAMLSLTPAEGEPLRVEALTGRLPSGSRLLAFLNLGRAFVDQFAKSTRLQLARGRRTILTVDFPAATRPVETLQACIDRTLGIWGIDVAARAQLRALPEHIRIPFSDSDYPLAALRNDAQGMVIARINVDADGRVTDCAVVRSSGSSALDGRTCQVYRTEARYRPAIDVHGQPVATAVLETVSWRIAG